MNRKQNYLVTTLYVIFGIIHKKLSSMVTVQTEKKIPVFHIMHNIGVFCPNSTPHNTMTTYSTKSFLPFHSTKKTSVMKKDTNAWRILKPDASMICSLY